MMTKMTMPSRWFLPFLTLLLLLLSLPGCDSQPEQPAAQWTNATKIAGKAQGLSHIAGLVVDEEFAYVTIGGNLADQQAGASGLRRITLASGAVTVLDDGADLPQAESGGLALDGQYVYWNGSGKLLRVAKSGGRSEIVATEQVGIGIDLAVDNAKVYWANHQYEGANHQATLSPIYAVAKGGSDVEIVADEQAVPHNLVVDKTYLYWLTPTTIMRQVKAGGQPEILYQADADAGVDGLAQDDDYLYFGLRGAGASRWALQKLTKRGGAPQTLVDRYTLKQVVVDKTHVYFFGEDGLSSDILRKVTKSGGEVTTLDSGYASGGLAQDKTQLYFAALDDLYRITK